MSYTYHMHKYIHIHTYMKQRPREVTSLPQVHTGKLCVVLETARYGGCAARKVQFSF